MGRTTLLAVLVMSSLSLADGAREVKRQLTAAANALEDARSRINRGSPTCRKTIAPQLDEAVDAIDDLRKDPGSRAINELRATVSGIGLAAPAAGCLPAVLDGIQTGLERLEDARVAAWDRGRGRGGRDRRDDRDRDRDRDRDDRDDDGQPQAPAPGFAQLSALNVLTNSVFDGESAVRLTLPQLDLYGLQGQRFYLGARFRSYEGQWSEWVTTQVMSVPSDPFTWKNAFNHFFRYSRLAEEDFSDGRFIARVSVFDANGQELAFREVSFKVRLPRLPPAPVVVVQPPPPVMMPPPVGPRDCGTGPQDVGCGMLRDGFYPMEASTFGGFLQSLRANPNETMRLSSCQTVLARNYLTALQLGVLMDFFPSEALKLEVVNAAAPHLVNPGSALGLAAKFRNPAYQNAFTQRIAAQPGAGAGGVVVVQNPPQPPPPGYGQPPPPPHYGQPPPPPEVVRDCGTGQDPGCGMGRYGQYAMDATTFQGFLQSLRSTGNEITREGTCKTVLANNLITALQLSAVLDLFQNELTRLDVAKAAAPRTVNPNHALGFASKWRNTLLGQDYTKVMAAQR